MRLSASNIRSLIKSSNTRLLQITKRLALVRDLRVLGAGDIALGAIRDWIVRAGWVSVMMFQLGYGTSNVPTTLAETLHRRKDRATKLFTFLLPFYFGTLIIFSMSFFCRNVTYLTRRQKCLNSFFKCFSGCRKSGRSRWNGPGSDWFPWGS